MSDWLVDTELRYANQSLRQPVIRSRELQTFSSGSHQQRRGIIMAKRGLGKGLGAFFGEEATTTKENAAEKVSRREKKST